MLLITIQNKQTNLKNENDTIRLNESKLNEIVKESISHVLNEEAVLKLHTLNPNDYNRMMCLNEIAQINLNERGLEKSGKFDDSRYYVYVKGEGGFKKFPHFHIKHRSEGWDIRMNIDGSFHSIKTKSKNRQNNEDFVDIEKISKIWASMPNVFEPDKTNSKVAEIEWFRNNS